MAVVVSALRSSVTETGTMAALYSLTALFSPELGGTMRLLSSQDRGWQALCQVLLLSAEPMRRGCPKWRGCLVHNVQYRLLLFTCCWTKATFVSHRFNNDIHLFFGFPLPWFISWCDLQVVMTAFVSATICNSWLPSDSYRAALSHTSSI